MNKSGEETILSLPERHNRILALLQQNGSISVVQLAELFKVSEVTIRKDLSFLEQQKKLYRTHGSAILISPYISDRHVNEKEKKNVAEKRAIGAKAASLVAQDDSIIIASGTTMAFLAREIKPVGHLTVITAAVPVTQILSQHADVDVIQIGARNMQNYDLLRTLGRSEKPVLLKRGVGATLQELLLSAEYLLAAGNPRVMLCERGIRTFDTFTRGTLDLAAVPALHEMTHLPVLVDPSHAAGRAALVTPLALAAAACGADGVMVEMHPDPLHARCDGAQALLPEELAALSQRLHAVREACR